MRLYKHKSKKAGIVQESESWYADVRLPNGKRTALALYPNEDLSESFARDLENLICEKASGRGYSRDIHRWIDSLNNSMRSQLCKWGLIEEHRLALDVKLKDQLDSWCKSLLDSGTGKKHADQNRHRAARIFDAAGFDSLADICAEKTMSVIGQLQSSVHKKNLSSGKVELTETGNASAFTKHHHLRACKQFSKWCAANGRLSDDPLKNLTLKNVRVEKQRRALSSDEMSYLLAYVETAPARWNVSGAERAVVYELAATTGLRKTEIASLKRTSFDFKRLLVKVEASSTKNRKAALLPVKDGLMDRIVHHLSGKTPTAQAFNLPDKAALVFQRDMTEARQRWIDGAKDDPAEHRRRVDSDFLKVETHEGKADFHSLRHTFGTLLAESGVHPKVAMDLMRHSDINLTMSIYTHSNQEQATAAISAMPSFNKTTKPQMRKKA